MKTLVTSLVLVAWLLPAFAAANERPAKGKLLVATEVVQGEVFARTVILLLHYDDDGAMGLVVNRPTDVEPGELVDDAESFSGYSGTLYWGGPVQMNTLRALQLTDTPPKGAESIVGSVHLVQIEEGLQDVPADPENLRYFIGYAGWGAGQLDREMARGSWHIVPATDENVFADNPRELWKQLTPPREHRATNAIFRILPAVRPAHYPNQYNPNKYKEVPHMAIELDVNGEVHSVDVPDDKPLLWVLREDVGLTGTKYACGIAQCGACMVHLDGQPMLSCIVPVSVAAGRKVTTVEGVESAAAMAIRSAWRELDVVQCGYCQSGQMMRATALLETNPSPSNEDIDNAMRGNLCRCATYHRIRAAIHRAAAELEA